MGLLSRLGNRVANFADGAAARMGDRAYALNYSSDRFAPIASAANGAFLGAGAGAVANPDNPGMGALAGAGLGAAGGAGLSLARHAGAGIAGGLRNMRAIGDANPLSIADEVRALARQNQGEAERYLMSIKQENPDLFAQVLAYLR